MSESLEVVVCIELIVQEDDKEHLDIVGDGVQGLKLVGFRRNASPVGMPEIRRGNTGRLKRQFLCWAFIT